MKIFAKRKRNAVEKDQSKEKEKVANKIFESDEIVKDILRQDPSSWNAKQRRLVKRHNERNDITTAISSSSIDNITDTAELLRKEEMSDNRKGGDDHEDYENEEDKTDEDESIDDDDDDDDNNDEDIDESEEGLERDEERKDAASNSNEANHSNFSNVSDIDSVKQVVPTTTATTSNEVSNDVEPQNATSDESNKNDDTSLIIDEELKEMLDKLNSKQRRTLVRQFDRDQNIDQLRNETIRSLAENEKASKPATDKPVALVDEAATIEEPVSKKRRRRGPVVDESLLSPEERIRRDEQRQSQAQARNNSNSGNSSNNTQIVVDGSVTTKQYRHPLNSERRRANRRKPKWEVTSRKAPPNEHDTSGYHMRKVTKGDQDTTN